MPIPQTMAAAVVEQFGGPLVMRELPVPTPGPEQALVEIMRVGSAIWTCTRQTEIGR